jgi:carbonic anhydrase
MGNLTGLLSKIQPALEDEKTEIKDRSSANNEFVEKVSEINVKRTVQAIMQSSPILKEMIDAGSLGIAGGTHNISTGEVHFYPDTLVVNSKWVNE